jgi:hypothetical protein
VVCLRTHTDASHSFSGLTTQEIYDLLPLVYQAGYVATRVYGEDGALSHFT